MARSMLVSVGGFDDADIEVVERVVVNHSDKHLWSDDSYAEFGKDVDVLDCLLYPDSIDEYLLVKPLASVRHYLRRAQDVWRELGIPVPRAFLQLDEYKPGGWLTSRTVVPSGQIGALLSDEHFAASVTPFAIAKPAVGAAVVHSTVAGVRSVAALPRPQHGAEQWPFPSSGEIALVWPGLGKYQMLSHAQAVEQGIIAMEGEAVS